eukprot:768553-Hanusia_phi.AAC.8
MAQETFFGRVETDRETEGSKLDHSLLLQLLPRSSTAVHIHHAGQTLQQDQNVLIVCSQMMINMKIHGLLADSDHVRFLSNRNTKTSGPQSTTVDHSDYQSRKAVVHGRKLPLGEEEALESFPEWCKVASTRLALLVVFDGMEKISSPAALPPWKLPSDINWLPPQSSRIKTIFSLRTGDVLESSDATTRQSVEALHCFERWGWKIVRMKTITREESQMVLRNYLKRKKTRSGTIQMSVDMMNNLDDNISSNREGIIMFAQACSWASFATIKLSSSSLSLQQDIAMTENLLWENNQDHSLISGARHSMISFLSDPGKVRSSRQAICSRITMAAVQGEKKWTKTQRTRRRTLTEVESGSEKRRKI